MNYTIHPCTQHVARNTERSQCMMREWIKHFNGKDKTIYHDHNSTQKCESSCQNRRQRLASLKVEPSNLLTGQGTVPFSVKQDRKTPTDVLGMRGRGGSRISCVLFRARSQKFGGEGGKGKVGWTWVTNQGTKREPEGTKDNVWAFAEDRTE